MRRTISRWIAAASALAALGALEGARRPHYGGNLRVEMRAAVRTLDPAEVPGDPLVLQSKIQLVPAVFETLVRLDERGDPQPWLAVTWTHDTARKRWVFTPRSNVVLHNDAPWSPPGGVIEVPDDRPIEQILRELARPSNAVVVRAEDGSMVGTGPFRIARWEPEKSATLVAHDGYWGGRPYLDTIELQMGRTLREQEADLDAGKTDVIEIATTDLRRFRQKDVSISTSALDETLALVFENGRLPDTVREALALSLDRAAIHSVLLQRQGEASGALLPRWLSGYSFLFSVERNVARARQLVAGAPPLAFAYDRQDTILRPVGERIAVNASEAGITLRTATGAPDVRLVRLPVTSRDPWTALADLAMLLKMQVPATAASPYEAERALLDGRRVIPLAQLPRAWATSGQVNNWPRWPDVWMGALPGSKDGSKDKP
jgi:peptide/nickel transport system substrate-binding protein